MATSPKSSIAIPADELREVGGAVNSVIQTSQKFSKAQLDMARAHNDDGRISEDMRASAFPAPMAKWPGTSTRW